MDILTKMKQFNRGDYQRDNFDAFLKKEKFSFNIPSVHIAGSNGKGSTAYYISSILKNAGYKVGSFTSPYFYKPNELIKINDVDISDDDINSIFDEYEKMFKKYDLSFYEIMTFIAFKYFQNNKCDVCVIECCLGGEYDATNIFEPILSIITTIALEHTHVLGSTLTEIAAHKGGIIKENVPVLLGNIVEEESLNTIAEIAKEKEAPINRIGEIASFELLEKGIRFSYDTFKDLEISSDAYYSITDACIAVEAVKTLKNHFNITLDAIKSGLKEVVIPVRMETINEHPRIIVDGAHNPEGINALVDSYNRKFAGTVTHIVFACFRDKNITTMLPRIGLAGSEVILTTFDHPRARTYEDYFLFAEDYRFEEDHIALIKSLMEQYPDDNILVTGSLAFASLVKKELIR
ncbi:MAG: bifunctional folylpolyglutamate synthase/dihydrofolate synthase [Erysipelotrichaceae bacterium]|nr:bifunctional folylpolyglutamate synthase/dihydrofolate synthase [Erysipelotrichaceae bacterium]